MLSATGDGAALSGRSWLRALPRTVIVLDRDGVVQAANPAAADRVGLRLTDLEGQVFAATVMAEPEHGGFQQVLGMVLGGTPWSGELRLTTDGQMRRVHAQVAPVEEDDEITGAVLTVEPFGTPDDTAREVSGRLTRLARVAAELQSVHDIKALTDVVVFHMAAAAGATTASLSVLVDDDTLAMVGIRGGPPAAETRYATYPADDTTPAGTALRTIRPLLLIGREAILDRYPDLELAAEGERSLLCLPLVVGDRAMGVASLSFPTRIEADEAELEFFNVMADTCAQALTRIRAQEVADEQHAKLTFLVEASEELASSLDYESTLRNVAWLAVPALADWCAISLEQDGILRTLAVAHTDPAKVALAEELQERYPPDPDASTGGYEVLRTGETQLVPEVTEEMLELASEDETHLEMLRALSLRSGITVALKARGRTFGTITWVTGETDRRFGPDDIPFGEEIARRAGIAIDNALLHSELREVADRLQAAVSPPDLPVLDRWQLGASYSSAGRASVGGDFYDAFQLQDGRLALVIGDVMGRGVEAAAAMAQIRAAVRALIAVDPDPGQVLSRLDLLYERFPSEQLVTMIYALADPARDEVLLGCAGHPPPMHFTAGGTVEFLEEAQGQILGVSLAARSPIRVPLLPGDSLFLFTDGLLERRGEDLQASKERLLDACRTSPPAAGSADLDRLVESLRDPSRDDDVAVLLAHRLPE